ncbi:cobyrinic acid a,c-diamide synthase [Frateuria sp. Soil773]|uniref:MinD/ParA family ATP-binding protein n=1 Tax=Frateuria sp. Soil773 TaxID=1736407 RepID=UPI0006F5BD76|nr:MinD/ParA family protein [Frateuria sp. Soil773]KRE90996.1 cobyrinic acid a,c-diamide synthase [Frateuria sp. Soil773]
MNQAWGLKDMLSAMTGLGTQGAPPPQAHQAATQAATLGVPAPRRPCRAIAVAGGKGGVGKTTVAVNLGMTLAMAGRDVMLLDADMGLANVDVLLGLVPARHLGHLLDGSCGIEDLVLTAPHGLKVIPGGSGARRLAQLGNGEHAAVIRAFDELAQPPDYLLVDTAAGLSDNVAMFAAAADEVVLVVCDEPASLTDAYALVKVLSRDFGVRRFRMVANMVRNAGEARALHQKLARVSDRFLDVVLDFAGLVPHDERLRQAIRRQGAVVDLWPSSRSAQAFKQLAGAVDTWGEPARAGLDRIAFFGGQAAPVAGW